MHNSQTNTTPDLHSSPAVVSKVKIQPVRGVWDWTAGTGVERVI